MSKWIYDLSSVGKDLRVSIESKEATIDAYKLIIENVSRCFKWIKQNCPESVSSYFEHYTEILQETQEDLEGLSAQDYFYAESAVNEILETFYDLCDMHRIWIN